MTSLSVLSSAFGVNEDSDLWSTFDPLELGASILITEVEVEMRTFMPLKPGGGIDTSSSLSFFIEKVHHPASSS